MNNDTPRYALYFIFCDEYVFSESSPSKSDMQAKADHLNRVHPDLKAIVLTSFGPHTRIDPYHESFANLDKKRSELV